MVGLSADVWVPDAFRSKRGSLSKESLLQSRGAGLMKANVQNQLVLGHAFSIPETSNSLGWSIQADSLLAKNPRPLGFLCVMNVLDSRSRY